MKGSCLCGAVAYEADELAGPIVHCSCRTCRKAHAAAFATTVRVRRDHFRWIKGEALVRAFESSPGKRRLFCSECGSHLVAERSGKDFVIVRAATLDDAPAVLATMHIWKSHEVPWLQYVDVASFPELPAQA